MSLLHLDDWVLYFFIYSVLGWVCETIFCSIAGKKFVARGFLYGPYCPIYGFGAVLMLALLEPFKPYPIVVFLLAVIICSALEYFASWAMERFFHMRWWDYSKKKFNIHGRVCLQNAIIFGIGGLIIVYFFQEKIDGVFSKVSGEYIEFATGLIMAIMFIDFILSAVLAFKLSNTLNDVSGKLEDLKSRHPNISLSNGIMSRLKGNAVAVSASGVSDGNVITANLEANKSDDINDKFSDIANRLREISPKNLRHRWILSKTSSIRLQKGQESLDLWRKYAADYVNERKKQKIEEKEQKKSLKADKTQPQIFASGIGFDKLFWIFVIASVLGYVAEVLFSFATTGHVESCKGLLYGPISQVYGIGAVLLTLSLKRFLKSDSKDSNIDIFVQSALVGGAFEVICSFVEEKAFGFISWYYTPEQLGIIGGRTSLLFMVFWGILGVVFIRKVYPLLSNSIEKIPVKSGRILTTIVFIVLLIDVTLTIGAVFRYSQRQKDIPASNVVTEWFDKEYPNKVMEDIYPGMMSPDVKKTKAAK